MPVSAVCRVIFCSAGGARRSRSDLIAKRSTDAIDVGNLRIAPEALEVALRVDVDEWRGEVAKIDRHFDNLGNRLPAAMRAQLDALQQRLAAA